MPWLVINVYAIWCYVRIHYYFNDRKHGDQWFCCVVVAEKLSSMYLLFDWSSMNMSLPLFQAFIICSTYTCVLGYSKESFCKSTGFLVLRFPPWNLTTAHHSKIDGSCSGFVNFRERGLQSAECPLFIVFPNLCPFQNYAVHWEKREREEKWSS